MSAASEALLQDLLDQARLTNSNLATLLRQSAASGGGGGGGGGGGATGPIAQNISRFNVLNGVLSGIAAVGNLVSNVFSSIFNFAGKVAGEFVTLAEKAFRGSLQLNELFGAANRLTQSLPLLGGVLSLLIGIFEKFVKYQEDLLKTYQQLTKTGASFAGSLIDMRLAASGAYLSLDQFSKIVRENSSLFATAMGGVDAGIKIFTAAQNRLVDPNGPFGKNLLGLGYTAEEASEMLGLYINMQGSMNKANRQNTFQMAESTNNLITNLDAYAKLTGESRDSLEKKLKEQALDEELKSFLSSLSPDEVASANQALAAALAAGGKGLQDEVKVRILSNNKVQIAGTEAANNLRVSSRNQSAAAAEFYFQAAKMGQGNKNFLTTLEDGRRTLADGTGKFMTALGGPGMTGVLSTVGGGFKIAAEQAKTFNRLNGETLSTEERLQTIRKEQEKQFNSTAAALSAAQMQLKIFGNQIGERFFRMLEPLNGPVMTVGNLLMYSFGRIITNLTEKDGPMDKLGSIISKVLVPALDWAVNWITDTFTSLSNSENTKNFFERLFERFVVLWNRISEELGPPMKKFWSETVKPMLANLFKELFDYTKSLLVGPTQTEANKDIYAKQAEENKKLMSVSERLSTAMAQGIEAIAGLFSTDMAQRMAAARIEADVKAAVELGRMTQAQANEFRKKLVEGNSVQPVLPKRATGSLGATGSLFENFGSKTNVELHGTEGVITPNQMSEVVANALKQQENKQLTEKLDTLTGLTQQLVALMQENANNSRRSLDAIQNLNGNLLV